MSPKNGEWPKDPSKVFIQPKISPLEHASCKKSAKDDKDTEIKALKAGSDDYIKKPFDLIYWLPE